jgi:outer membrane protein assembly factor BamB
MKKMIIVALLFFCIKPVYAADWQMFRADTLNSGTADEILQPPLTVKWQFKAESAIVSSPAVYKGKVIIGSRDNNLYCLNIEDGALAWNYKTSGWIDSSVCSVEDRIYFTSRDGKLYCLDFEDGKLLWTHQTGGTDFSSPAVDGGKVFCGAGFPNKYFYALESQSGKEIWKFETGQMVYSSPAVLEDNVFFGSNDGHVYCLNKDDGTLIWKYQTKGGIYTASPVIDGERLYIAAGDFDWTVYALDIKNGKEVWTHVIEDNLPTPNYVSTVSVSEKGIFLVAGYENQHIYCVNALNGALRWKQALGPASRHGFSSSPCVTEDIVYVSSAKGVLKAFDISTGVLQWEKNIDKGVLSSPAVSNGKLYIGTIGGTLYAFE